MAKLTLGQKIARLEKRISRTKDRQTKRYARLRRLKTQQGR